MFFSFALFYIFSAFCLISTVFVIFSKNPVFSILFLIFTFFNVSCILFLFDFEFIPISFIVIYVGAIAVLFLFVLMMLNIKLTELLETSINFFPVILFIAIVFIFELASLMRLEFNLINITDYKTIFFVFDVLQTELLQFPFFDFMFIHSNITTISLALFNDYLYCFILSGFVLLLAMISAITLTLQKRFIAKQQNVYIQILREYNEALVHFQ
jgi:NADH-quinone oxidoreductase subunit J